MATQTAKVQIVPLYAGANASGAAAAQVITIGVPGPMGPQGPKGDTGTLPADVAYTDQPQTFSAMQTFAVGIASQLFHPTDATGYFWRNLAGNATIFSVDDGGNMTVAGSRISTPAVFALGSGASATGSQATAIGLNAAASNLNCLAVGVSANAAAANATAIGVLSSAAGSDSVAIGNSAFAAFASSAALGAGLNLASNELVFGCLNGFGAVANFRLTGFTDVQRRSLFALTTEWVTLTDATRAARFRVTVNDAANPTTGREVMRGESDGTQPKLGFFGQPAAARPSLTYSRAGESAAAAQLRVALAALGLVADSTTA